MKLREITEAPAGSPGYGMEGKPEWFDRAVKMKLDNPNMSALEIARQVGTTGSTIQYWLTGIGYETGRIKRPKDSYPFQPEDFSQKGAIRYPDGAKPEWYDQALKMAKAGETFVAIGKKLGVSSNNIGLWLVKGKKFPSGKIVNPDAELEPRKIRGQRLDINLLNSFIQDGYTDSEIIELVADDKGPQIASQVKTMLPVLRKKLNPATQVIDKTRTGSMRNPDITGFVK